jgi:hypothetical protein
VDLVLDKHLLGTETHVRINSDLKISYVHEPPDDCWYFSGEIKDDTDKCLDTVFKLENVQVDTKLDLRLHKMLSTLVKDSANVPWSKMVDREWFKSRFRELLKVIRGNLISLEKSYYESTWVPLKAAFGSLHACTVNLCRLQELLALDISNKQVLNSFLPVQDDITASVVYDRFGTRTGRLTVKSGPQILTLNKKYRNVLKSRSEKGAVYSLDFSSLETRIVLYEANKRCELTDVYDHINKEFFDGNVERSLVKLAVISEIYGAHWSTVAEKLKIDPVLAKKTCKKISSYLNVIDLKKQKKEQYVKLGYVRNKYGRRVQIDDPSDHVVLNYYVQSTGVDVTLFGFLQVIDQLAKLNIGVPLFFLHDALIVDLFDSRDVDKLLNSVTVPGYVQSFPLKIARFDVNCTNDQQ